MTRGNMLTNFISEAAAENPGPIVRPSMDPTANVEKHTPAIQRNVRSHVEEPENIYNRARRIYFRARVIDYSMPVSIL